jgi:hypothetical protein
MYNQLKVLKKFFLDILSENQKSLPKCYFDFSKKLGNYAAYIFE